MIVNGRRPGDDQTEWEAPTGASGQGSAGAAGALFLYSEDKSSPARQRRRERRDAAGERIVAALDQIANRHMDAADEARSNLDSNYPEERCYLELLDEAMVWRRRASRVRECGQLRAIPYECKNGHRWEVAPMGCGLRCCPYCERKASAHVRNRLEQMLGVFRNPVRMLTLTIRNYPAGGLSDMLKALSEAWDRFRKSSLWHRSAAGAIAVFECTVSEERGWHAHLHVAWDGKFMPWQEVLAAWQTASRGAGQRVDVRRGSWAKAAAVRYLSKYASKGVQVADLPQELVGEFVKAWWRFRTLRSYGTMFRVKIQRATCDGLHKCPTCGEPGVPIVSTSGGGGSLCSQLVRDGPPA